MEPQTSSSKGIIWIVIGVIIIALATYFFIDKSTKTEETPPAEVSTITNSLEVSDQLADSSVIVSNIALDKGGFVVVYDAPNGAPGTVIGTKYFERGERPGTIDLTTPTKVGSSYAVSLYIDNGDKIFTDGQDAAARNAAGQIILQSFKALKTLPDIKA